MWGNIPYRRVKVVWETPGQHLTRLADILIHSFYVDVFTQAKWKHLSTQNLYLSIHSSFTHNSHKLEMAPIQLFRQQNRLWRIHTMDYYSAMKGNELLLFITTWMNHENTMVSERKQTKAAYCILPCLWSFRIGVLICRDRKQIRATTHRCLQTGMSDGVYQPGEGGLNLA